jgi:hypothetical protein
VDLTVADHHLAPRRVDRQLADPDRPLVATVAATQDGGDSGPQGSISPFIWAWKAGPRGELDPYLENSARFSLVHDPYLDGVRRIGLVER